jgi:hypothetical protein
MLEHDNFSLTKTAGQLKISRHTPCCGVQRLNVSVTAGNGEDKAVPAGR